LPVLDVTLRLNGLELQQQIGDRTDMPIIFIAGCGDVQMTGRHEAGSGRVPHQAVQSSRSSLAWRWLPGIVFNSSKSS
jgi:hypothetical protein